MAGGLGYLIIDNRACGGFRNPNALLERDVMGCCHCGSQTLKNPLRDRPRASCPRCGGKYVCDTCAAIMRQPDYVHRSKEELKDLVLTGKVKVVGGTWAQPLLLWL